MWEGPANWGCCHLWLVVLGSIRKQAEQARRSKPITSTLSFMTSASAPASRFLPCSSSCSDFLWWWTVRWKPKPNKPFSPPRCFGHVVSAQYGTPDFNRSLVRWTTWGSKTCSLSRRSQWLPTHREWTLLLPTVHCLCSSPSNYLSRSFSTTFWALPLQLMTINWQRIHVSLDWRFQFIIHGHCGPETSFPTVPLSI